MTTSFIHEDGTERILPDDSPAERAAILARDGIGKVFFGTSTQVAALTAEQRASGLLAVVSGQLYRFDSAATGGGIDPSTGTGQWVPVASSGSARVFARNMTTGALGAYTRTGNVILADAVGAVGAIDGVTNVAGDRLFLNTGAAAAADVGVWVFDTVGAAGAAYQLTRAPEMDESADISPSMVVQVQEGTANADREYVLTTNGPITLNTTGLTFSLLPSYTDLGAVGGAARIGSTGPSTVQADITARPTAAVLAAVGGAATVGSVGPSTVQADITALQALAHHLVATKTVGFADLVAMGAVQTGFVDFDAALPAAAIVLGCAVDVTAIVDNAADGATLTSDLGVAGIVNLLLDGVSLNSVAVVGAPLGTVPTGFKAGITPRITIDGDVNFDTLTKGSFTAKVAYITL